MKVTPVAFIHVSQPTEHIIMSKNYNSALSALLKHERDGYKTATRLAFERALYNTEGQKSKVAGRVFRALLSNVGITKGF